MLGAIAFELGIVLLLLVANGVFAASELALVSARRSRLEAQAAAGDRRAVQALKLSEHPETHRHVFFAPPVLSTAVMLQTFEGGEVPTWTMAA